MPSVVRDALQLPHLCPPYLPSLSCVSLISGTFPPFSSLCPIFCPIGPHPYTLSCPFSHLISSDAYGSICLSLLRPLTSPVCLPVPSIPRSVPSLDLWAPVTPHILFAFACLAGSSGPPHLELIIRSSILFRVPGSYVQASGHSITWG